MSVKRIALLALILTFGGSVEVLYRVRGQIDTGPWGVRLIGGRFFGKSFPFEQRKDEAAAPSIEIRNAFGAITTKPSEDGAVHVTLRKVVFLPTEAEARAFADRVRIETERDGDVLRIRTSREEIARKDDKVGFETHLDVELPESTRLLVRSEHGKVTIAKVRSADVEASFDTVEVTDVTESVQLKAQHGETRIRSVGGNVSVEARHGAVHAGNVTGALTVKSEHGDVDVDTVGSSSVELSHGDLEARKVKGDLTVRGSHGAVRASDVQGRADIETSFDPVSLEDVSGDTRVKNSHGEVQIERFAGSVDVEIDAGAVKLRPAASLTTAVKVASRRGDVELTVPAGSRFSLDARAKRGEVHAQNLEGLSLEKGRDGAPAMARGDVGGGGAAVTIETERGDIRLNADGND